MKELTFEQKIKVINKTIFKISKDIDCGICLFLSYSINEVNSCSDGYDNKFIYFPEILHALTEITKDKNLKKFWLVRSNDGVFKDGNYYYVWGEHGNRKIRIEFLNNIKAMLINEHKLGNI